MAQLEIETEAVLTAPEILDWFYSTGFLNVWDVKAVSRPGGFKDQMRHYLVMTSDQTACRAVRALDGQTIRGIAVTVRQLRAAG